jgi:hypothetical protein
MKPFIIAILLILSLILTGCGESSGIIMECAPPLIPKGDGCCLDADKNGVCDVDEAEPAVEKNKTSDVNKSVEDGNETKQEDAAEEEEADESDQEETEEPAELKGTQEDADKIGKMFAERWQLKQYNTMYVLFTDSLQKQKTATEFSAIMELDPFYKKVKEVEFKGASLVDEDTAELKLLVHTNVQKIEIPATTLEFEDGAWKVNVFADVFTLSLYDAACSGYRYNKQYRLWDCAFDLAKKVKDDQYCDISKCHYVECLKALGKPAGYMQEAKQCFECQPVTKTTNECILDVATKHEKIAACNVIPESKYSDKYCTCYGGYAKFKGTIGYCNMISNPDYKYLCEKKYNGGYC